MAEPVTNTVQVTVPNNEGIVGTPTVFTFDFSQAVIASNLSVAFIIDEKKIIIDPRIITKPLKAVSGNPKQATVDLTFPEALAGATLEINFSIMGIKGVSVPPKTLKIKRADGIMIVEEVYWCEQEFASFGTTLPHKREICKNEWAFLHIHTKGMFGHNVFAQIREYDNEKDIRPIKNLDVEMRDNVVSIPYSMASAITDFKAKYSTIFEKECLELYARAHFDKTKINEGPRSPNLFLHYKKDEKNPAKPTSVPPVKVVIAEDEEEPRILTKAKCSLEFRPDNTYIGDYGFDWVRRGDTGAPGYHHDHEFKECMGKHYDTVSGKDIVQTNGNNGGPNFRKDNDTYINTYISRTSIRALNASNINTVTELDTSFGKIMATSDWGRMIDRLRKRYKRLVFSWNDASTGKSFETCTPIMTLMNGKTAKLTLQIDIKTQPQKIVFEFNNSNADNFLKINNPSSKEITSNLNPGNVTHPMEIECIGEFDDEYTLYARAFGQNEPKAEICGMLRILPNGRMYQHRIKIVLFSVITNINGNATPNIGKTNTSKNRINQILGQALVVSEIEEVDLDTTKNSNFRRDFCKQVGQNYVIDDDDTRSGNLKTYLEKLRDSKYDNYYKIYFFDEAEASSNGYSWGYKYTLCFNTANPETGIHELLHALELAHTFDGYSRNTKFTYQYQKTANIMDYSHLINVTRTSLYHWQWQILNLKIR